MATVSEWRAELQTRLSTVVRSAYAVWPRQIAVPAAIVRLTSAAYGADMSGDLTLTFDVIVLATEAKDFERDSHALDAYLDAGGSGSIVGALEDGQVRVSGFTEYGIHEVNGVPYIGCRFSVEVFA